MGIVLEGRVPVAVEGQGNLPLADQPLQENKVAPGVLAGMEDRLGHGAGGVVHRQQQNDFVSPLLQPGVGAAVHLDTHTILRHSLAPEPVLLGPTTV